MNDWKETTNFQDIEEKPEKKETAYDRYQAKMHSLRIRIPKERLDELNRIVKDNFHMSLQGHLSFLPLTIRLQTRYRMLRRFINHGGQETPNSPHMENLCVTTSPDT